MADHEQTPKLEVDDIHTYYGSAHVIHGVSLEVGVGEVVSIIGRNGAGKTTTMRSIMGLTPPREGTVTLDGTDITGMAPEDVFDLGVGFIPEDRGIFPDLTVRENLLVGLRSDHDPAEAFEATFEYFPRLEERTEQLGGTLSGGEQQMLAIGRTLVSDPEILLIDEPTEGLMPSLREEIRTILGRLHDAGKTILLVEQDSELALDVADRAYVMSKGQIRFSGTTATFHENEAEYKQYLSV